METNTENIPTIIDIDNDDPGSVTVTVRLEDGKRVAYTHMFSDAHNNGLPSLRVFRMEDGNVARLAEFSTLDEIVALIPEMKTALQIA